MESNFQFSNPVLLSITFKINEGFECSEETEIKLQIEIEEEREENSPEAIVKLSVCIGDESDDAPFYVYAEEAAKFRWDENAYGEDAVKKLLSQNAPALLLAYLRPIVSSVTNCSPFSGYDIPFINFTHRPV